MTRLDDALDEILIAHTLDPTSPIIALDLALIQHFSRDSEAALEQIDLAIELNPFGAREELPGYAREK